MLILLHEDVVKEPIKTMKLVYNFLNINSNFISSAIKTRPQRVVYNIPRLRFLRIANFFLYDYNKDKTRLRMKKKNIIMFFSYAFILIFDKILSIFFKNKKPIISISLRKKLSSIYLKDIISNPNCFYTGRGTKLRAIVFIAVGTMPDAWLMPWLFELCTSTWHKL